MRLSYVALLLGIALLSVITINFQNSPGAPIKDWDAQIERFYPAPQLTSADHINPIADYEGEPDEDLTDLMVPIPMKDRVPNYTGIQCVWVSIEALGRYAEEPKLINLHKDPECKSYSGPSSAARKLKALGVKFEQTTSKSDRSLIKKAVVEERRGCLFAVPGHAMVLVHYDEEKGVVKYFNNSDKTLQIRTWTMQEFNRRWDGWVLAIYADNDIIPNKYSPPASRLPIIDKNNPQNQYQKDYILMPKKTNLSSVSHSYSPSAPLFCAEAWADIRRPYMWAWHRDARRQ